MAVTVTVAIATGGNQTTEDRNQRQNERDGSVQRTATQLKDTATKSQRIEREAVLQSCQVFRVEGLKEPRPEMRNLTLASEEPYVGLTQWQNVLTS